MRLKLRRVCLSLVDINNANFTQWRALPDLACVQVTPQLCSKSVAVARSDCD